MASRSTGVLARAGGGVSAPTGARSKLPDVATEDLHAELHRLQEDIAHLEQRLAYAQIDELRAKVVGNMKQVAAPGGAP